MKNVAQTVLEAGRYYTIAAHTGNVIQAVEGVKNGGDIRLGKYEHKPEQEWAFVRVGDGVYRIRNRANGKLMDLMMTGTGNGTWLHLWEDVGGTSQMWTVQPNPDGTVRLRSSWAGGKCLDTVGLGAEAGAILQVWQEVNGADQLWTIAEVKERAKRTTKKEDAPVPAEKVKAAGKPAAALEEPKAAAAPQPAEKKPAAKKPAARKAAPKAEAAPAAPAEKPKRKAAPRKKAEK